MKKLVGLLLLVGIGFSANAAPAVVKGKAAYAESKKGDDVKGIQFFKGTWEEALKAAETEKKLIFLDAYASWCGPCKLMARNTFTNEKVGDFFNANFINVKMDMEKTEDGKRLSRKYRLSAYPTLYFVNNEEKVVYESRGYQKPNQLIGVGERALMVK